MSRMESIIMNILCSGNPNHTTIASGVKKSFPSAMFVSRTTGYDFTTAESDNLFKKNIINYNVFVNSSYIKPGVQLHLMEMAVSEWMQADIKGHIINIGTTAEWTDNKQYADYIESKQRLRLRSMQLNEETGITGVKTTYIIVGGVNDGKPGNENYLNVSSISHTIEWILQNPSRIALIQIDVAK
jgi:hypothetical protein